MRVSNYQILNNADLSMNQVSQAINLYQIYMFAIQAVITGSPVGTMKLQVSCDFNIPGAPSPPNTAPVVTNWTDVASSVTAINGATSMIWEDQASPYAWVRLVWVFTSGTGNVTARINTRGV